MREKRGTHVGVVISFVIFVTFLLFLYSILIPPLQTGKSKQALLDFLQLNLIEKSSVEDLTTMTIENTSTINNPSGKTCIKITNVAKSNIAGVDSRDLLIKDETENTLLYKTEGAGDNSLIINLGTNLFSTNGVLLKIWYEPLLGNSYDNNIGGNCVNIGSDVLVGQIKTESSSVFTPGIVELINSYNTDYATLKTTEFGFPDSSDFWFNFTYANETSVWPDEKNIPSTLNVYVKETSVQYTDADATKKIGTLLVKVW